MIDIGEIRYDRDWFKPKNMKKIETKEALKILKIPEISADIFITEGGNSIMFNYFCDDFYMLNGTKNDYWEFIYNIFCENNIKISDFSIANTLYINNRYMFIIQIFVYKNTDLSIILDFFSNYGKYGNKN